MDDEKSVLLGELERFVVDYNKTFGNMKMQIAGAMFGRRIRKLSGLNTREYVIQSGRFWVFPHKNGGSNIWAKSLPMPSDVL